MAKPKDLELWGWNQLLSDIHEESDRGVALAAGAFVENYLGLYIAARLPVKGLETDLFAQGAPLEVFHNRILVARAFELISASDFADLMRIKKIRNRFAHHPLHTTFGDDQVMQLARQLSQQSPDHSDPRLRSRYSYIITIALICGSAHVALKSRGLLPQRPSSGLPDRRVGEPGTSREVTPPDR